MIKYYCKYCNYKMQRCDVFPAYVKTNVCYFDCMICWRLSVVEKSKNILYKIFNVKKKI